MVVVMVFTKLMLVLVTKVLVGIMGDYRVGDDSLPDCHMLVAISGGCHAGGGQVDGHVDVVGQVDGHVEGVGRHHGR